LLLLLLLLLTSSLLSHVYLEQRENTHSKRRPMSVLRPDTYATILEWYIGSPSRGYSDYKEGGGYRWWWPPLWTPGHNVRTESQRR
jgi:hypothetical protein